MATVTEPITLDKSINTTENPSRNIADVLAEELARIAGNILPPNASQIAYDNSGSGLIATNVQDAIDEVISSQADVIADTMADLTENKTATVTDGVADFETIDGSLVKSLVVEIEPSQSGSGTPSPSNIRPITGWTQEDVTVKGKNLYSGMLHRAGYAINSSGNEYPTADFNIMKEDVLANTQYTLSGVYEATLTGQAIRVQYFDSSNTALGMDSATLVIDGQTVLTFTTPSNTTSIHISLNIYVDDLQLELGSTATTYEPYHGKTYTTAFGQTVYGGMLDVRSGELTIEKVCESFTSAEYYGTYGSDHAPLFYVTTSNNLTGYTSVSDPQSNRLISNIYNAITVSNYTQMPNNEIRTQYGDTVNRVYIRDDRFSSKAEIDAYLTNNPVQIVGRLATPTTIYLTPQQVKSLVGENHISASTGDVLQCKYSMLINGDDLEMLLS